MMRRPVSSTMSDPRFKTVPTTWQGVPLETWCPWSFLPPAVVGMYDSTINQVTYPHLVQLQRKAPPSVLYRPRGTNT